MRIFVSSRTQQKSGFFCNSKSTLKRYLGLLSLSFFLIFSGGNLSAEDQQPDDLILSLREIADHTPGDLGVYLKHLGSKEVVSHQAERHWYLASLVKVPLAIAVLQAVEQGQFSREDTITLKESDYVDGSGDLLFRDSGENFSISTLLEKSLVDSDSTATDMLMRHLGEEAFNQQIREAMVASGFNPFTTIIDVRYQAYQELHPKAVDLSNIDYVEIRSAGGFDARVEAFRDKLDLQVHELRVSTLEEAFSNYYQRGLNAGTLEAAGQLLERLVRGELLNDTHTDYLLGFMERITTGDRRLKAGLPKDTTFAQKTGTQIERACNMGVVSPRSLDEAVVMVVCVQDYGDIQNAEKAFQAISQALAKVPKAWMN